MASGVVDEGPPLVTAHLFNQTAGHAKPQQASNFSTTSGLTRRTKVIIAVVVVLVVVVIAVGVGAGVAASKKKNNKSDSTSSPGPNNGSPSAPRVAEVEGMVVAYSVHAGGGYGLQLANSSMLNFEQQPIASYTNSPVPAGSIIRVTCTLVGSWSTGSNMVQCANPSSVQLVRTATADLGSRAVLFSGANQSRIVRLQIVPVAASACGYTQQIGESEILGYIQNAATQLDTCSYGRMRIDMQSFKVRPTIDFECTDSIKQIMQTCTYNDIHQLTRLAEARMGASEVEAYTNHLMLLPNNMMCLIPGTNSNWAALADTPGSWTWFFASDYSLFRVGTILQELIHNYGLVHGNKDEQGDPACQCHFPALNNAVCQTDASGCHEEYGDKSTPMGRGDGCLSAPEMYRLNWATALARLDASSLQPGTPVRSTLPATYKTGQGNMVIVSPTWKSPHVFDVFFSLRNKGKGDVDLLDEFAGKLNIHVQSAQKEGAPGEALTHIIGTVDPNSREVISSFSLVVQTSALQDDDTMEFSICRYQSSESECAGDSGGGGGGGDCADQNGDCAAWATSGYCNASSEYSPYMYANCKQACGLCTNCEDNPKYAVDCPGWARDYGCVNETVYSFAVGQNCLSSCGLCSSNSSTPALTVAGRQCVDLSSRCAAYREQVGCSPADADARVFMATNCQATCQTCAPDTQGTSVNGEVPLGCAAGYGITGVQPFNSTSGLDFETCYTQCWDNTDCYFFTHSGDGMCDMYQGLQQVIADPDAKLAPDAAATMCAMGTNRFNEQAEIFHLFYCVPGLDIKGTLVAAAPVQSEQECAQACNDSATCWFYVLLKDNTCVLKSNIFSGDDGVTERRPDIVQTTCIQTMYINTEQSRRRRQLMQQMVASGSASSSTSISGGRSGMRSMLSTWSKASHHHLPRPLKAVAAAAEATK